MYSGHIGQAGWGQSNTGRLEWDWGEGGGNLVTNPPEDSALALQMPIPSMVVNMPSLGMPPANSEPGNSFAR